MWNNPIKSFMDFQYSPGKYDAIKWNHILSSTSEQDLLKWFNLGMVERIKKHIQSISDIHFFLPSSAYDFAAGPYYGPVLDPLLVSVLKVQPKLNPLLIPAQTPAQARPEQERREYLTWNMLLASYMVQRSIDSTDSTWSEGRDNPATFPRVTCMRLISHIFPFTFEIPASDINLGVTCGDLIDGLANSMREKCGRAIYESLSATRQSLVSQAYRRNRSQVPGVPGSALGEGLRRLDFLGMEHMWRGLREDSILVKEICGWVLPCTWILECTNE
ncbi:hypothetical protein GYMLUDRAFT_736827 [Collybiopsis luxurians FD-317 M1]|uniref:DUF6699 domain-containing protein n=1 Tax=Collybiopsis luxurians FD-317 M1 TaxID=944289 RepID=A0A0D0CQV7_9AGAR|nr:hypothetical protein GYMLUDRAFT_736827 [Collybiopsis luxurians FD-317 M1]